MSFFAGLSAGIGEAQGQYNNKMMDFMNEKSKTMANLYGHLADRVLEGGDPYNIAPDLIDRSSQWSQANPMMNPKGYKDLVKNEKGGIHGIIDKAHQGKVTNYTSGLSPNSSSAGANQPSSSPKGPSFGGSTASQSPASPFQMPDIDSMLNQLTGGQDLYGPLGNETPRGKMAMSIVPEVVKQRMEMQQKMQQIEGIFDGQQRGDRRSPSGSAAFSEMARMYGLNSPVTQWRSTNALYQDADGNIKLGSISKSLRDQSTWETLPSGEEKQVRMLSENPRVETRPDGSTWASTLQGPIRVGGNATMPIQSGTVDTSGPTPEGGSRHQTTKVLTPGASSQFNQFPFAMPPGAIHDPMSPPVVGTVLPPGLHAEGSNAGPPNSRTSTSKPHEAYKDQGSQTFSLEKLEQSPDQTDKQIAAYIVHPESFDDHGKDRRMWNYLFDKRTNGGIVQAPVPVNEFKTDFQKQRLAIVQGFNASKNISNILNDTDGAVVGVIAGNWMKGMNKAGLDKAIGMLADSPNAPMELKTTFDQLSQQHPELAHALQTRGDLLASKAADLITTMRLFNFADVKNTVGGVQGVSRVYSFLRDSLMDPGMGTPLILGHLGSLNRNMADGLLALEQARWGPKIPYIREKELMADLYWGPYVEGQVGKTIKAAAEKGINLSKQDALFLMWRRGKIQADPGKLGYETMSSIATDTNKSLSKN
jgi:hypothetical protein